MRLSGLALLLLLLAACAGGTKVVTPVASGGNAADGIVTMSSTRSLYVANQPDWQATDADVDHRCRLWGYRGVQTFEGWQEACRIYDRHGRCARAVVTRFYQCHG